MVPYRNHKVEKKKKLKLHTADNNSLKAKSSTMSRNSFPNIERRGDAMLRQPFVREGLAELIAGRVGWSNLCIGT